MVRMRILTASEQEALDKPPLFDHKERKQFFDPPREQGQFAQPRWSDWVSANVWILQGNQAVLPTTGFS